MDDNPYASPEFTSDPVSQKSKWFATLVTVLGVAGCLVIVVAILLPARRTVPEASLRWHCRNNLKQIGLALANYKDTWHAFPPAYTVDSNGKRLHSWRTLILPFMDQQTLYDSIDLSKTWDDPANSKAYQSSIPGYRCTFSNVQANQTTYMAVIATNSCLLPTTSRAPPQIPQNLAENLIIIETDREHCVHWMDPTDVDEKWILGFSPETKFAHRGGTHAVCADGSVTFVGTETPAAERRAMISISEKGK